MTIADLLVAVAASSLTLATAGGFVPDTRSGQAEATICANAGAIDSAIIDTMHQVGFEPDDRFGGYGFVRDGAIFDLSGTFLSDPVAVVTFKKIYIGPGTRVLATVAAEDRAISGFRSNRRILQSGKAVWAIQLALEAIAEKSPC